MGLKISLRCLLLLWCFFQIRAQENNVCLTYTDYYAMKDNPRCFYDFSVNKSVPDIITGYGYPLEIHNITNKDGYILTLFRLPHPKSLRSKREVIYVQHGLCTSSADFVGLNRDSLAFVLFNAGFEVWLGNTRGTEYSNKHVKFTAKDAKYWDFSMDDTALVDLPTIFEYMSEVTGQMGNFVYVGHSLGTSAALMYSSAMPEHAKKMLKFLFLLGPAYKLPNMISPGRIIGLIGPTALRIIEKANLVTLTSDGLFQRGLLDDICFTDPSMMKSCMDLFNLFYGPYTETTAAKVPYYFHHFPAGASIKTVMHSATFINNKFSKYDYGYVENMKLYGSPEPPEYNVSKIEIPIHIFVAKNDWACPAKDAQNLYYVLSPQIRRGFDLINLYYFNHMDYLYGRDAGNLIYSKIVNTINGLSV